MLSSQAKFISAFSKALLECRIIPHFQPIVQLSDEAIVGFEVLARWQDPEYGNVSPDDFIPSAEKCGLLDHLFEGLMVQSMRAAQDWPEGLFLSFNLSPSQLHNSALVTRIEDIATRCAFPLTRVQIEIVETADLEHSQEVTALLARLRDMGCVIAADDFGMGYSSLTWLRTLPFSKLKIDKSFVRSMLEERESRKIASALIGLGQSLDFAVVAEGIETSAQANLLRHMGCSYGQGYLFAPAVAAHQVLALLHWGGHADHSVDLERLSLERRAAQVSSFYASSDISLCFIDTGYVVVKANETFARRLGKDLTEVQGKTIADAFSPTKDQSDYLRSFRLRGLPYPAIEVPLPGGRTDLVITHTVHDEVGELLGFSLTGIDITDRKMAEAALRESEAQFRFVMDNCPHLFWIARPDGEMLDSSPRLGELVSLSFTESLERGWLGRVDPAHRDAVRAQFEHAIATGRVLDIDYRLQLPEGQWTWVRTWGAPRRDETGAITGWYGTVTPARSLEAPVFP